MTHQADLCKTVRVYILSTYFIIKSFNKDFFSHAYYVPNVLGIENLKYGDQLLVFALRSHVPGIPCISFLLQ